MVGRFIGRGLENHKRYYYRVCAVDKDGTTGAFSETFEGITKEV